MKFKDYYQIMGVERDASATEIKQAYRKLAHLFHPDISKDAQGKEKFQEIGEAYAVLKNPEKREAYDSLGRRQTGEEFKPAPEWQHQYRADSPGMGDADLADLFAAFGRANRNGRARSPGLQRGQDFEVSGHMSLEQLHGGGDISVQAALPEYDADGMPQRVVRTFHVRVPKGAANGQRLRLTGKGGAGRNGGSPGDLYVALELIDHPLYRVSGRDLYMDLPLAPWEAVLGALIRIPTLDGRVELTIKPGSTGGQRLRLKNQGLQAHDGTNGALFVVIVIVVPSTSSDAERALYEQIAASSKFQPRRHFQEEKAS